MELFWSLLPLYLIGNFHCLGMCGPLVMIVGRHPQAGSYFFGRAMSYTAAGALAGGLGQLVPQSATLTLACGVGLLLWPVLQPYLKNLPSPKIHWRTIPHPFVLGLMTILLPCCQTLVVFSACALFASPLAGAANGLAFAFLTAPALFFAMSFYHTFKWFRQWEKLLTNGCIAFAGTLTLLRGFADLGWIPHAILSENLHILLY